MEMVMRMNTKIRENLSKEVLCYKVFLYPFKMEKEPSKVKNSSKLQKCINKTSHILPPLLTVFITVCMIFACVVSYRSVRTSASSGFKYYTSLTVESGETLWDIVDSYVDYEHYKNKNSYITEVQSINHLDENCSLDAGQIIILPYYSGQYVK